LEAVRPSNFVQLAAPITCKTSFFRPVNYISRRLRPPPRGVEKFLISTRLVFVDLSKVVHFVPPDLDSRSRDKLSVVRTWRTLVSLIEVADSTLGRA
jgi:hypothetical protein